MELGKLGLPIVGVHEQSRSTHNYTIATFLVFNAAVTETAIGRAIQARLDADSRVQALLGKMISRGSGAMRFERTEVLAAWWLWRANNVGAETADRDLEKFLNSEQITAIQVLWVYGVEPTKPITISNDIQLLHIRDMQDSSEKEEFLRENFRFGMPAGPPAPTSALLKRYLTEKLETETTLNMRSQPSAQAQEELTTLATVINCLPGVCCIPGYGTSYLPPEVPLGPLASGGGGTPIFDVLPRRMTHLAPGQEALIASLFESYDRKSTNDKARFQRALLRLAHAKTRINDGDRVLDLGIALEMLLLNSEHKGQDLPGQLNLHFRLRGSWLIANDSHERKSIYRDLGRIYGLRSQIAHNGFSDELDKLDYEQRQSMLGQYIGIAERIFEKLIIDGPPPEWASLVLGAL